MVHHGRWCLGVGWTYGWVVPRGTLDLGVGGA